MVSLAVQVDERHGWRRTKRREIEISGRRSWAPGKRNCGHALPEPVDWALYAEFVPNNSRQGQQRETIFVTLIVYANMHENKSK